MLEFDERLQEKEITTKENINIATDEMKSQQWYSYVSIITMVFECLAIIDAATELNCINEGIMLSKYFEKIMQALILLRVSTIKMQTNRWIYS